MCLENSKNFQKSCSEAPDPEHPFASSKLDRCCDKSWFERLSVAGGGWGERSVTASQVTCGRSTCGEFYTNS
jgi:hypothetical protein